MRPSLGTMPCRIHHHPNQSLVLVELVGTVRWYDAAAVLNEAFRPDLARREDRIFWDARRLVHVDIPPQGLVELVSALRSLASLSSGGRSAILLRPRDSTAVAEMIAARVRSPAHPVLVTDDLDEALAFLDLRTLPRRDEGAASG